MIRRDVAAEIMHDAADLVNGQRAKDYGEPEQSFNAIAAMWTTYLNHPINKHDVANMMVLLKVCRNMDGRRKLDNYIDIIGYAGLAGSDLTLLKEKSDADS
jgi:hypothetical protein